MVPYQLFGNLRHPALQNRLGQVGRLRRWFDNHFDSNRPLIRRGGINGFPTALRGFDPQCLAGNVFFHTLKHQALAEVAS
jgi:hypothetical protein